MEGKSKFEVCLEKFEKQLKESWYCKDLDPIAITNIAIKMASEASNEYYSGWNEGFKDSKNIYDRPLRLTA